MAPAAAAMRAATTVIRMRMEVGVKAVMPREILMGGEGTAVAVMGVSVFHEADIDLDIS